MSQAHALRMFRSGLGLTVRQLSELSGIDPSTIHRIERGSEFRINIETAQALTDALSEKLLEVFSPHELSHLGRPPRTGTPIKKLQSASQQDKICPGCRLQLPLSGVCSECNPQDGLTAVG